MYAIGLVDIELILHQRQATADNQPPKANAA